MSILRMTDLDLRNKRVLIRVDFNVPIKNGQITSEKRLLASAPTIKYAVEQGAKVIVISHLGQPEEGIFNESFSLKPVANWLSNYFDKPIRLERTWLDGLEISSGEVVLCENVRFNQGEKKDDDLLAKKMANLCDIFVMDAFATAHRAQASTHGIAKFAKVAAAGPLLVQELEALSKALDNPKHPLIAITGGSKVSTKLQLLENFLNKVNYLILGGGLANTFLLAQGYSIGQSLCETELINQARQILKKAREMQIEMPLPTDVRVAKKVDDKTHAIIRKIDQIKDDEIILDIGPETQENLAKLIQTAGTIVWNGPVGMFEYDEFGEGTRVIANAIISSNAFTLAGGGDTVAAIEKFGIDPRNFSYVSTAGGAFLEYLQGIKLPAVEILKTRGK